MPSQPPQNNIVPDTLKNLHYIGIAKYETSDEGMTQNHTTKVNYCAFKRNFLQLS